MQEVILLKNIYVIEIGGMDSTKDGFKELMKYVNMQN